MVRVTTLKGSGRAILDYLDQPQLGLSLYYSHDHVDDPGVWTGRGAEALGLSGEVDGLDLQRLLDGRHPDDDGQLGYAYGEHSARGYDVTFNAPKSVSLIWAFGDADVRDEVTAAHTAAMGAVIDFVDAQAHTRVTVKDETFVVDARGLAVATFCQHTSRTDDPHLHTHAVVVAKVQDGRGRWLAFDARMIKHDPRTLSALYDAGLRAELTRRLGVTWEPPTHGTAEMVGMPTQVLQWFSTRTGQVEARYQLKLDRFRSTMGRDPSRREDWRLKREAAADSRPPKHRDLTLTELQRRWMGELRDLGLQPEQLVGQVIGRQIEPAGISTQAGQVLVHDALVELQDTVSTWRRNDVIREIARRIPTVTTADAHTLTDWVGKAADGGLERLVELAPAPGPGVPTRADGRPITESTLDRRLTTGHILREEEFVATWAVARFETVGAINLRLATDGLDRAQAGAARVVAGTDPLVLVVGPAGTGKTAMLRSAGAGLSGAGRPVFGLAPSATAAAVLAQQTGIRADTVDKLLYEHRRPGGPLDPTYRLPPGTTVIVDEAGMLATPKLAELARLADAHQWRVVLVGDPYQLAAVGRAGMFTHLCATGRVHELDRIHRFREPWERAASLRLRTGDTDVLAVYDKHDRVHDGTSGEVTREILTAWHAARTAGESVAMLAVTNESVERLNQLAQQIRLDLGHLDRNRYLSVGGTRLHVGDEIVTRSNDRTLRTDHGVMIRNRAGWTVAGITGTGLTVHGPDGTALLPAEYVRESVELGYARTVHAAQGLTVDHSLLLVDGPVDGRAVYVGLTRGQLSNDAYVTVDDKMDTARSVLEQAVAADWADRPALDVRAELHHELGRALIVTDRRLGYVEPLPDADLKKLLAEHQHIRRLDPVGHARDLQWLQRDDTADRHLRDSYHRRHDILTHQRVELTGQRAQLGLLTLPGTRRDLDDRITRTERDLRETNSKIGSLEQQISNRAPRISFERGWLDQHDGLADREHRIGAFLKLDAAARGQQLSYDPPAHLIARLGEPPLGDERALRAWERDAGQLEQHHIALPQRLHAELERCLDNALDVASPARDLGRSVADDFGLSL